MGKALPPRSTLWEGRGRGARQSLAAGEEQCSSLCRGCESLCNRCPCRARPGRTVPVLFLHQPCSSARAASCCGGDSRGCCLAALRQHRPSLCVPPPPPQHQLQTKRGAKSILSQCRARPDQTPPKADPRSHPALGRSFWELLVRNWVLWPQACALCPGTCIAAAAPKWPG